MNEWLEEKTFWDLQNVFLASAKTGHDRAREVLLEPLMRTMQFRPAPELGWRVATRDHKLGEVWIKAGDKIALGIVSATQEDLAKGATPDVYPIFGGDRSKSSHPTHACPGYKIGMGVLLGMLAALMERPSVRSTPAPLTVALSGLTTPPPTAAAPPNTP